MRIESLGTAISKYTQGLYDNQDIMKKLIRGESNQTRTLIENRTNGIMEEIHEMKKKFFTTHQQAAFHNKEVERIIRTTPPAIPRSFSIGNTNTTTPNTNTNTTRRAAAQQGQEPEREAQVTSPHSSTEPGRPLLREQQEGLTGSSSGLDAGKQAPPTTPTGTQPKVVITRKTKEGAIAKPKRQAAQEATKNNKE